MKLSEQHRSKIQRQRRLIISDILMYIKGVGAISIALQRGIMWGYEDDPFSEVIRGINQETQQIITDENFEDTTHSITDCSTEQLLSILEELEENRFTVTEIIDVK